MGITCPLKVLWRDGSPAATAIEATHLHLQLQHPIRQALHHPLTVPLGPEQLIGERQELFMVQGAQCPPLQLSVLNLSIRIWPLMSPSTPYVQVGRNAQGSCCWEVVLAPGLVVQVSSGAEVAQVLHGLTPLPAGRR